MGLGSACSDAALPVQASSYCTEHDTTGSTESPAQRESGTAGESEPDRCANRGTHDETESDEAVAPATGSLPSHRKSPRSSPLSAIGRWAPDPALTRLPPDGAFEA